MCKNILEFRIVFFNQSELARSYKFLCLLRSPKDCELSVVLLLRGPLAAVPSLVRNPANDSDGVKGLRCCASWSPLTTVLILLAQLRSQHLKGASVSLSRLGN